MKTETLTLTGQTPEQIETERSAQATRAAAERARHEIQNKAAKRLTGTLGTAAQKTMLDEPGSNTELFN